MRSVVLGGLAAALVLSAAPAFGASGPTTVEQEVGSIADLLQKADKLSVGELDARVQALIAAEPFAELNSQQQCALILMAASAKARLNATKDADLLLSKAVVCAPSNKDVWSLRLHTSLRAGNDDAAVDSLTELALHWPAELVAFGDEDLLRVTLNADRLDNGRQRRFELLEALNEAGWAPTDPSISADYAWAMLAAELVDAGRTTRAAAVAQKVSDPWTLSYMRADKRFDALFDHGSPRYDPEVQSVVELELRRKIVVDHPDVLGYIIDYADDLTWHHHPELALRLLDDALARVDAAPPGKPPYRDLKAKLAWAKDYRSRALLELGRADEALAVILAAAIDSEERQGSVNQIINLAGFYSDLGRPEDALRTLGRMKLGQASAYGKMIAERVRLEALVQLDDKTGVAASMKYLQAHEADAPGALFGALLATGDLDAVAAMIIRRLADPDKRLGALEAVQNYAQRLHPLPGRAAVARNWAIAMRRPDVGEAIDKVGRVERYSFMDET